MGTVSILQEVGSRFHVTDVPVPALRLVDNKAVLYFDAPTPSEALNWYRGKHVSYHFYVDLVLTRVL